MNDNHEQNLELIAQDPELQRCLQYLEWSEYNPEMQGVPTKDQVAEQFGITRRTLYNWISRWTREGTLEQARKIRFVPKAQATLESVDMIVDAIPDILARQIDIAKHSQSDFAATNAAKLLLEMFAIPAINRMMQGSSSQEMEYLSQPRNFSPEV